MTENKPQIILAPLQGFTDCTYRNVFCDHFSGLDEALAPFISTMSERRLKPSRIKDVFPENNTKLFVVPQILSNSPEDFVFLADHLFDLGHKTVNWNLGCPHSKIAKKFRGSGLLCHPDRIDDFLTRVIPRLRNTLSVKIRLGRKNQEEVLKLLPIFDAHPLDEIILHPRTGIQMYTGNADHDAFELAQKNSRHSFTYNGDIVDLVSFQKVKQRFPEINRFMIGRGMLSNPFLAEDIKGLVKQTDRVKRLIDFHDDLMKGYEKIFSGPGHLTGRMKGFWTYFGPSFKDGRKPLKKILKSKTLGAYRHHVDLFFETVDSFLY